MNCIVYRCEAKAQTYLYLRRAEDIESVPDALRARLGTLTEVMQLTLSAERKLAQADVAIVMTRLSEQGWYLQLPPSEQVYQSPAVRRK